MLFRVVSSTAQAQNAQAAGAAAVLVYDDQINDYFVPASDGSIANINIPAGAIPRRTGQLLVSAATVRLALEPSILLPCVHVRLGAPAAHSSVQHTTGLLLRERFTGCRRKGTVTDAVG